MSDPIIEAAARALRDKVGSATFAGRSNLLPLSLDDIAAAVLAAVTPLIRAATLEDAAKVAEEWTGQILSPTIGDHYALLIRSLKEKP